MRTKAAVSEFSCLALKDKAQAQIMRETKGMTPAEFRAYLRRKVEAGPFADLWYELEAARGKPRRKARAS